MCVGDKHIRDNRSIARTMRTEPDEGKGVVEESVSEANRKRFIPVESGNIWVVRPDELKKRGQCSRTMKHALFAFYKT